MTPAAAQPTLIAKLSSEPFRLFFPLGALWCLIGVGYWMLLPLFPILLVLPATLHPLLQIEGFMAAFVLGFLGTALPRLTEAPPLSPGEVAVLLVLHLATVILILADAIVPAEFLFSATLLVLPSLLAARFLRRRRNPPPSFVFLPFAFASASAGSAFLAVFHGGLRDAPAIFLELGAVLVFQGFPLFLLLGVGGFLIRSILGWAPALPARPSESLILPPFTGRAPWLHALAAVTILAGLLIESAGYRTAGILLRAIAVTAEAVFQIKAHRRPVSGKLTAQTLRFSVILVAAGHWIAPVLDPALSVAVLHIVLAGGFGISAFAVATRVIFSHCGRSSRLNAAYRPFTIAMWMLFIGALTRVSADFMPAAYIHHLAYAGALWAAGIVVWTAFVLKECVRDTLSPSGAAEAAC